MLDCWAQPFHPISLPNRFRTRGGAPLAPPVAPSVLTMASSRDSSATFRRAGISADVLQSTFERFDADKGWLQL